MIRTLRKDLLLILAVAAVFLSLSYAIGFVTDRSPATVELETAFLSGARPQAQPTTVRVWRKPVFEKIAVLNSKSLKDPAKMRAENSVNIFVLDWSDLRIKEFSPDGKLVRAFGEEAGRPSSLENPTGFSLDSGGNLWVCDLKQHRIGVFNADGSKRIIRPPNTIYRIAAIGDVMMTMVTPMQSRLFETYDLSGQQLNSFGELLADQSDKGLVLDGDIVADTGNHGIIYGGRYLGIIGAYDVAGNQRFLVQTIDHVSQPMVSSFEGGLRKVKRNSALPVLSLSLVDNDVYILSGVHPDGTTSSDGKVLDIYNKQDGHYLYSWELPAEGEEAIVASNYIYIRSDKEVTVWRFKSDI
jgi:NHL repeat-containing protein